MSLSGLMKPIWGVKVGLHSFSTSPRDRVSDQPDVQVALLQDNITAVRTGQKGRRPLHR